MNFWIDLQGRPETTAWTDPATEEAFLWMDLNHDQKAQVTELFGSRMIAPDGGYFVNGFVALLRFDQRRHGGDRDGKITRRDAIWPRLRLWVDRNHDGVSQRREISKLSSHRIIALHLTHYSTEIYDEHWNELYLIGSYTIKLPGGALDHRMMADVEFRSIPN